MYDLALMWRLLQHNPRTAEQGTLHRAAYLNAPFRHAALLLPPERPPTPAPPLHPPLPSLSLLMSPTADVTLPASLPASLPRHLFSPYGAHI